MKTKDQIILENIYSKKILKEDFPKIPTDSYVNGDELKSMNNIKLIAIDGILHTPIGVANNELKNYYSDKDKGDRDIILVDRIGDGLGDVIIARWPKYNPKDLAILLYGARETGQIPSDTKSVLLPDGTEFEIDDHGI